eukprot:11295894-Alexandrium_andersonii.AAC.1
MNTFEKIKDYLEQPLQPEVVGMHGAGKDARESDIEQQNEIDEERKPEKGMEEPAEQCVAAPPVARPLSSEEPAEQRVAAPP